MKSEKNHLTTADVPRRERVEVEPSEPRRGPQTADLRALQNEGPGVLEICLRHALPAEWREFRERVMARVNSKPRFVMTRCQKCGFVSRRNYWAKADAAFCVKCNWQGFADGGFMKDMTPAEVKRYEADRRAADEAWKAQNEKRALYLRNEARGKAGLDPLTMEEYRAELKAEAERKRALEARLGARRSASPLPQPPAPDLTLTQRGNAPAVTRKGKAKR